MAGTIHSGNRVLSQTDFYERAARVAAGLKKMGISQGNSITILLRNDIPFLELMAAAGHVGAYLAPLNWHAVGDEAGFIIKDSKSKILVTHADFLTDVLKVVPEETQILVVETPEEICGAYGISKEKASVPEGFTDYDKWREDQQPTDPRPSSKNFTPLHMVMYSGGTTGLPKGIRRRPMAPEDEENLLSAISLTEETRTLVTGPLYHNAPNMNTLNAMRKGATVVLQPRFDLEEMFALVEKHKITFMHMVPTMFVRALKIPEEERKKYDFSSLELVVHGAAPCSREVKKAMIDWWGPIFAEYYGGTETGAVTLTTSEEWLKYPGTVGAALENTVIKILDKDRNELQANEEGEIFMWNNTQPDFEYIGQDAKRKEVEVNQLITCGDIGYLNEEGYLFLCDRIKDMVISGGANIYPAEIEGVLITYPGVKDCAVFGIPNEEFGESLAAVIQPEPGQTLDPGQVIDFLSGKLAKYKVPRVVEFQDELPREDSGKIFKRKLREPYWKEAGRSI